MGKESTVKPSRKAAAQAAAETLSKNAHARYGAAQKAEQAAFDRVTVGGDVLARVAHADAMDEFRAARADLVTADEALKAAAKLPEDPA